MIDVATPQKAVSSAMHAMPVPDDAQLAGNACESVAASDGIAAVCTQRIGNEPSVRHLLLRCG